MTYNKHQDPNDTEVKKEALTVTQLMWRKFKRNRLAMGGSIFLICFFTVVIFHQFFIPYPINKRHEHRLLPPQRVRIMDENGITRPFVYGIKTERDPRTFRKIYEEDRGKKHYIYFLVKGYEYKLFGLFSTNISFFGIEEPHTLHLFGTDELGKDLLSRIIFGGSISLSVPIIGVSISVFLGTLIGTLSGYLAGVFDHVIQRMIELMMSFPRIPLWMALAIAIPPTWNPFKEYLGIAVILSLIGWANLARQVRGKVLAIREEEFILAAKSFGAGLPNIIFLHLIPSVLGHIIVVATLMIPGMIIAESALGFLGIGITPPLTSWGVLLKDAQNVRSVVQAPWLLIPGIFIIVNVLAFNFLGDGLRDASDPFE